MNDIDIKPQLRFPEFTDEWQLKKLGDILEIGSGRDYKHLKSGDIPVYGTGGLMLYVNDYLYDGKSVAIGRKGTIDQPRFLTGKFWTVDTLFYTHSYRDSTPEFIYSIFKNINWKKWNEASGVPSLSSSTIKGISVKVPSKPEQQKIADFLTTVDDKITVLDKKVELLEQYKKGVMQQIFSQQVRFKDEDGQDYPEWEEKRLGEIASIKTGKKDANIAKEDGQYRFYTCSRNYLHTNVYSFDGEAILVAGNADVGLCHYYNGKFEAYQRTYVLQDFETDGRFLYKYLSHFFRQYALSLMQTSAMTYITLGTLENFTVPLPSEKEQQKIATFLATLDDKITAEQARLIAAREWKKGLMQRMFA